MAGAEPPEAPVLIPSQVVGNNTIGSLQQQRLSQYFGSGGTRAHPISSNSAAAGSQQQSSVPWGDYHLPGKAVTAVRLFRVYSQNVNGLSTANGNLEVQELAQSLAMKSVAVAGIQETNRNFERTNVAQSFHSCFRHTSTHHQGSVSSAQLHFQSDYQPGGTAVMALNKWATRFLSKGSDVSGRWSWLTLVGSGTLKITFISAYRVCDGATYSNPELSDRKSVV